MYICIYVWNTASIAFGFSSTYSSASDLRQLAIGFTLDHEPEPEACRRSHIVT